MTRVAVITGASRGIGKGVATFFAQQGYRVALMARSQPDLTQLADELEAEYQAEIACYPLDVSCYDSVIEAINDVVQRWQQIDVLFNNAGVFHPGTSAIDINDFNHTLDVNLRGAFHLIQAITPQMKQQQSGYIFNMASRAGKIALANTGAYAMSKFGLVGFSESLFRELAPYNIKVTALCPSVIATELTQDFSGFASDDEKIQVDDVVKTVDYLLSLGASACVQDIVIQCTTMLKNPQMLTVNKP